MHNVTKHNVTFTIAVVALSLVIMLMYAMYITWQAQIEFNDDTTWILETQSRSIETVIKILQNQLVINEAIFNRLD